MTIRRNNGEGSISQRKDGSYMGQIVVGKDDNGKLIRKTVYGSTKSIVVTKLNELKSNQLLGKYIKPDTTTVYQWANHWLKSYKSIKLKPRTYDGYETIINTSIKSIIGHITLQKLTSADIQGMYNKRFKEGLSANSVGKIHSVLKPALKQALHEGLILKNPADFVQLPSIEKKDMKVFTKEEQMSFESNCKEYSLYEAFIFNLDTGLRASELLALSWDDIDLVQGIVKVHQNIVHVLNRDKDTTGRKLLLQDTVKTRNGKRIIPLTKRLIELLKELKVKRQSTSEASNIVFCNSNGDYVLPRNYIRTFQTILVKANIEQCSPHTLRHTFATRLFEAGCPAKTISQLLGHGSVSFTLDTYTHVLPDTKKEAIELLENSL